MTAPVAIIMGSQSDWDTMKHTAETLDALGIAHEALIVSAHRTPDRLYEFAKGAKAAGYKVIIAGAGGAAHLPGMTAAMTPLPVFGVPVESKALSGQDSLLSIVQMPAGIPVGTLAIGKAGAANAALLAAAVLALSDEKLAARLDAWRVAQDGVTGKSFLNGIGIATAEFCPVDNDDQLTVALGKFNGSGVLKTRRLGYDGKGQRVFRNMETGGFAGTCEAMGNVPLILESLVAFEREVSVIAARGLDGAVAVYDPAQNVHREGILRTSTIPAAIRPETAEAAKAASAKILAALDY